MIEPTPGPEEGEIRAVGPRASLPDESSMRNRDPERDPRWRGRGRSVRDLHPLPEREIADPGAEPGVRLGDDVGAVRVETGTVEGLRVRGIHMLRPRIERTGLRAIAEIVEAEIRSALRVRESRVGRGG